MRKQVYQVRHDFDANGIANTYTRTVLVGAGRIKNIIARADAICAFKIVTTKGQLFPGNSTIVDNSVPDGWLYVPGTVTSAILGHLEFDVDLEISDPSFEVTVKAFRVSGTATNLSVFITVEEEQ